MNKDIKNHSARKATKAEGKPLLSGAAAEQMACDYLREQRLNLARAKLSHAQRRN